MRPYLSRLCRSVAPALLLVMMGCGGGSSSSSSPSRLTISAAALPTGTVGVAYSSTLSASGGTTPYSWMITSGSLPAGLSLSSQAVISGTPTANATSSFTVQVSDSAASPQTATAQMAITIFSPLSVATTSLADGIVGHAFSVTLQGSGGDTPYTWSVVGGQLPAGLSLSANGTISGTPSASGTSSVTFQVVDSASPANQATAQLNITVVNALMITTTSLPNGILNQEYSAHLAASGGATPYTWSIASGTLPPGLSLSAAGTLSGTPTIAGNFTFAAQVEDSETPPQTATASFSVTIAAGLKIMNTSLLPGTVNAPYNLLLTAAGGVAPITWSVASGALPPGLTLSSNGVITGTPSQAGVFGFTLQVQDAEMPPLTATAQLNLPIASKLQVTTSHYDNFRSGQDVGESTLTLANVNTATFGKLFSFTVDGTLYAQPLYMPDVTIPGNGVHNVVFVATEHDSVYALDADNNTGTNSTPLWQVSFINPSQGITTISQNDVNCDSIAPEIGITSTPVIDPLTNTMFVLAETKENGQFFHRLHALDIATGAEKQGSPVAMQATYPGTGDGSSGGILTFDPIQHLNRPGLLLNGGKVFIAWSSNCDNDPYHGWVMAYDENTLQQSGVWVSTPNGHRGGIWTSGAAVAADLFGRTFLAIGNGTFDTTGSPVNFGDSIVRMTLGASGFSVDDYFTPYDQSELETTDEDLGSGGVLIIPDQAGSHPHELVQAGKEGSIYVVDREAMGGYQANNNSQIIQNLVNQVQGIFAAPAYWNGNVYFGGIFDNLKAFLLSEGMLSTSPSSISPTSLGYPGATPVISSNGTSNGIVWAVQNSNALNGGHQVLHAYDATNLANEIYNSAQNEQRDDPGLLVKFSVPIVANGKVYVGSATQLNVYGLLPQ